METICAICNSIRSSTKSGLSFQKLLNQVRKEFRLNDIELKVKTRRDKNLLSEVFYANGYYDPVDDEEGDVCIELVITHNFPKDHVWFPKHSTELLIQIFDTVVHELRHQRQYRKRKFKLGVERGPEHKEYLADPEEIDAYSISIAIELCRSLGKTRALRYLHNVETLSRLRFHNQYASPCLGMYKGEFPNQNDPVIKQLIKKVYVRLKKVDTDFIFM
jgi:hypothetical protein